MRWLVDVGNNVFEDVGASHAVVGTSGSLEFYDYDGHLTVAYSVGKWETVAEAGYE